MKVAVVVAFVISGFALLTFPVVAFFTVEAWPVRFSNARDFDFAVGTAGVLLYPALWAGCLVVALRKLKTKSEVALGLAAAPYAWFALAFWFGFGSIRG